MNLKVFTPDTMPSSARGAGKWGPVLGVSKAGAFRIGKPLMQLLAAKEGDQVVLAQDDSRPGDWFIAIASPGFTVRQYKDWLQFNNAGLAKALIESLDAEGSLTLPVAAQPTEFGGVKYYALITKAYTTKR